MTFSEVRKCGIGAQCTEIRSYNMFFNVDIRTCVPHTVLESLLGLTYKIDENFSSFD